jgi:uncharacterized protein (TIGR01319 family)
MTQDYMSLESVLALECGSTTTKAFLIDRVEGEFRLVARGEAPSTVEPPWSDVTASVRQAIGQVTDVTGWRFLDERGQIISPEHQAGGVDAVVVIASASEPLRLVVFGIMQDVSLHSAHRALAASHTLVEATVSLDRRQDSVLSGDIESQVRLIQDLGPDLIVMVGGVDGGASQPVLQSAQAVALARSAMTTSAPPPVLYAGNSDLRKDVAEIVGGDGELRAIDNVRPNMTTENPGPLQAEIEELYRLNKMERLPGFSTLADWSPVQVLPTATAFAHTIQYLAHLNAINVLGVDVGGAAVSIATVVDEQFDLTIRSDLGISHNIARILEHASIESVQRWLPFEADPIEIQNIVRNKALRYQTLPQTRHDLLLEQAIAREFLRLAMADIVPQLPQGPSRIYRDLAPKFHLVVGRGGVLANAPHYGQAALILLDALQPVGVAGLALDNTGLLAPLGAVATVNHLMAAEVMERDALLNLGTVVAPVGTAREGEIALTFKIEYEDTRALEVEVAYGSLEVIPLPAGQTATLELRPTRRFDVGLGSRGQAGATKVEGGVIGIIIDARGRPLPIDKDPEDQQERVQRWLWDMGS